MNQVKSEGTGWIRWIELNQEERVGSGRTGWIRRNLKVSSWIRESRSYVGICRHYKETKEWQNSTLWTDREFVITQNVKNVTVPKKTIIRNISHLNNS